MTRERRFHLPELDTEPLVLSAEESHHLVHVLRLHEGAKVTVFDGKGRAIRAEVAAIVKGAVTLRAVSPEPSREPSLALTVAVSPPKGDRMSFLVQKLTELAVHRIVPLTSDRSGPEASRDRWKRVALEACKQSGRSRIPEITEPRDLEALLREDSGLWLAAHPGAPPLFRREAESLGIAIGPEGGWSERELGLLTESGVTLFGMGPRTLRTETAAIAATALVQYLYGDLS